MNTSTHIQLVTISPQENEASLIEGHLRDRGQPVRMQWLQASDDLEDRLGNMSPDLIFCAGDNAKLRDYALHCCNRAAAEIPVLILCEEINAEAVDAALQKRARDAVSVQHMDHLQAVYLRELAASKLESNLREARAELKALRARLSSLVSVSQLAVANLQDGILIDVSDDFSQLFGFDNAEKLTGQPFLELIDAGERSRIKKLLNRCASGKVENDETETQGIGANQDSLALTLRLARVETDEGNCVEIQVRRKDEQVAHALEAEAAEEQDKAGTVATESAEEEQEDILEAVPAIDEAESERIYTALAAGKIRVTLTPFITLDGQKSSCSDFGFELQNESGQWFSPDENSRAAPEVLRQYDARATEKGCQLLKEALDNGQAASLLVQIQPASLDTLGELKASLEKQAKAALDGGQNLVITLDEAMFINKLGPAQELAKQMRSIDVRVAIDNFKGNAKSIEMMELLQPDFVCLDRAATQLLINQGSEHKELAKAMQRSRDSGMHIVAYPLKDAHSMAMLWQRGVNMVRGGGNQAAAA